jgi:hypothetical protein
MVNVQNTVCVLHHSPILFCSRVFWFYYVRFCQIKLANDQLYGIYFCQYNFLYGYIYAIRYSKDTSAYAQLINLFCIL